MSSVPEPPPKVAGIPVTPNLIEWLKSFDDSKYVIDLINQRYMFGLEKYGQCLMSEDGRNTIEDARQEAGDLLQYLYKGYLQNIEDYESLDHLEKTILFSLDIIKLIKNKQSHKN